MTQLFDPKNDFVFKRIFGSEENKDVLLAFLNETLKDTEREPLSEIVLLNPNLDKDSLQDKLSILDVRVKTQSGKYIDIEMQLFNKYDIEKRSLYLGAKLYEAQLTEGQKYKELNKCITINILNYSFLPDTRYHSIFQLREITTHAPLIDDVELHFIELPKLQETAVSLEEGLVKWLLFLKRDGKRTVGGAGDE